MQNRTELSGVGIMDRLRQAARSNRAVIELSGSAVAGFIMANSFIFGGAAPFGVALAAALSGRYSQCAALGALLGYVFSGSMLGDIKYIAALLLVVVIKWITGGRLGRPDSPGLNVITAFLSVTISSAIIIFTMDYTLYDVFMSIAEILLSCGTAYFFTRTLSVFENGLAGSSRSDISCAVVSGLVGLMGLAGFMISSVSVGRVLSVLLILLCARYGGEAAGAIVGISAGIAIGLASNDYGYIVSAYALGGLVAGVFSMNGRVAVAGVFVIVNAVTALFAGNSTYIYSHVIEIFAASVLFMIIPGGWTKKLKTIGKSHDESGATQRALYSKLGGISATLREIRLTTSKVSEKLGKMENTDKPAIYVNIAEKVCRRCGMRTTCWQFSQQKTMTALGECVHILKKDGALNRENAPRHMANTCCKLDVILPEINNLFRDQMAKDGVRRKVSQVRSVVTDQFEGMAQMLDEISEELCSMRLLDKQRVLPVKEYLEREHFQTDRLLCYSDEFDRIRVELVIPSYQLTRLEKEQMTLDLSSLLEAELDLPQIKAGENDSMLVFHEKASFFVETGAYQISNGGTKLCGDTYDCIRERMGKSHLILSDGMGSGGNAAVDSSMASGLISKLLSVGVGHEAALKMVNSALLIKSGEESLATIDICTVDLFTGRADFYKAGAAPSYIIRGGRAAYIESTSLPAGILRGVAFEKSSVGLKSGDVVVMVSDGVTSSGSEWIQSELELIGILDIQRLCEQLAMTAKMRRHDGREDDITVVAAAIRKGI